MAKQPLEDYRAKRDFQRTDEPSGHLAGADGNRFVVHKHHASHEHYDLRLELGGVLKSWAVPKGPSLDPREKRLAVETEDHPVEYIDFEGVIPAGEYGGGQMIVWDTGTWAPMGDPEADLAKGAFKFRLAGKKLTGGWMLARLKPRPGEKKTNWLLFKERDPSAEPDGDILTERPESVKSGRRIEELAPPAREPAGAARKRLQPGRLPGAVKGTGPVAPAPQLATAAPAPPGGEDWLHEIKLDGYRTLAFLDAGSARLVTRSGLDWTHRYGDLGAAIAALPCREAILDGEIVVQDGAGISRFTLLQEALSRGAKTELVYFAFDLLRLDGWDLTAVPLDRRKALLAQLLDGGGARSAIQLSEHVRGGGPAFYESVSQMGLEGVVSKRASAPYQSGRSKSWLKVKAKLSGDFVIAGYTLSEKADGLGALALGEWVEGDLAYRGKVGTGFDAKTLADLLARLRPLEDPGLSLPGAPRDVRPVRPVLTARIQYSNLTSDGSVRHGVFVGLREAAVSADAPAPRARLVTEADLAAVWVTNPTRRLFGRSGPTKLDVAVYYAAIGDFLLPHVFGRPVSLVRCPTGKPEDCFFQRHAFVGMPEGVESFETRVSDETDRRYLTIATARGYLALAQFGVVEFHAWGAEVADLEHPDRVVFDLDPGEGIAWREVVEAAVHVRDELGRLGLTGFAKTTGGKGVHVVVPVTRRLDWKSVHAATGEIATAIAATAPDTFTTTMGASNRKRRIFIDFHRNARSATAVAPYSLRARNNLPASAPLSWGNLEAIDDPADLNYSSLPALVAASGDAWATIADHAGELPAPQRVDAGTTRGGRAWPRERAGRDT
ncbi:DNA ligase D [Amaricoccus macauensis]|nr:DNA ligase D [Amaricoccus macauensis]